jgi:chloramphenicol O-acetyltransferase
VKKPLNVLQLYHSMASIAKENTNEYMQNKNKMQIAYHEMAPTSLSKISNKGSDPTKVVKMESYYNSLCFTSNIPFRVQTTISLVQHAPQAPHAAIYAATSESEETPIMQLPPASMMRPSSTRFENMVL